VEPAPGPADRRAEAAEIPWRQLGLYLLLPALLLRLFNLVATGSDPVVAFPIEDGLSYSKWALTISSGDWLGSQHAVFWVAPLYPYVLAVLQTLGLGFWPWPQLLNCLAGTGTVALVFVITTRLFGLRAAWLAGGALAAWGPELMYECLLDKVSLGLVLSAAALLVLIRLYTREVTPKRALLAGLLVGATALIRENLLLLAPVAALLLWHRDREWRAPRALLLGTLVALVPSLLHNGLAGGSWSPTSYSAGSNLWMGNHEGANGSYHALIPGRSDPIHEERDARLLAAKALDMPVTAITASQVNGYWLGKTMSFVFGHPFAWAGLELRKLQWFVYHTEPPDSVPYDAFCASRPWLLPSRLLFGLPIPLAVIGAWAARRDPKARFVAVLGLTVCCSVVIVFVVSRFRLTSLPFLLPLAANGVLALRERTAQLAPAALALLIPAQLWIAPRPPQTFGYEQQLALLELNRGTALGTWTKDKHAAVAALERSLEHKPDLLPALQSVARLLMAPPDEDFDRALTHCRTVVELTPDDIEARHNLAFCLHKLGQNQDAVTELEKLSEPPVISVKLLAKCLTALGRTDEARAVLARHNIPAND